jgi:hypothetical protein
MNRAFAYGKAEGLALFRDFTTTIVMTKKHEAPHTLMEKIPGWKKIYEDPISKLFIRTQENDPLWIQINQNGIIHPDHPPPWAFPG